MATITFSTPFLSSTGTQTSPDAFDMLHRVYGLPNANVTTTFAPPSTNSVFRPFFDTWGTNRAAGAIHLMKGTVPSNLATLTTFSSRASDVLATWNTAATSTLDLIVDPSAVGVAYTTPRQLSISTSYNAATTAGVATWIWLVCRNTTSTSVVGDTVYHSIVGTVGVPGSGADLIIPNTSIASGKLYRIGGMVLTVPQTFTY